MIHRRPGAIAVTGQPAVFVAARVAEKAARRANDTLAKLQAASHTSGDAARPLPRLKMYSEGVTCNGRDAVANESTEALQRRANESAVCQLQLVVRRPLA
jgi:hypothetical protein